MRTMVVVCTTEEEGRASLQRHKQDIPDDLWPPEESFDGEFLTVEKMSYAHKQYDCVFVTHEVYPHVCGAVQDLRKGPDIGWTYYA